MIVFVVAALAVSALAGGWLWLRDSSFVAVRKVQIAGLTAHDAPQIRAALRGAARNMTTLHVRPGELRDAVSAFPIVKNLRVRADFPHGLRIEVVQNVAVARLDAGGRTVPVAADGALLPDQAANSDLPRVPLEALPTGTRVRDSRALRLLVVAGAAPATLRPLLERIRSGQDGVRAELRGGLRIIFGSRVDATAKWAAAARVIADPTSAGAAYIDVRVPERPVAGGFGAGQGSASAPAPSVQNPSTQAAAGTATPTAAGAPAATPVAGSGNGA
ncbi:MAG: cell division protein FtsQ [Solirubrobacteraceae bacterium]|nr:cell division protein FtsQ [Solirubrobacteraceae bacterium]